jgi:hypothetical protein
MPVKRWVQPRLLLSLAFVLLFLAAPALAQDQDTGRWFDVPALPPKSSWVQWLIGVLLALVGLAVSFKNPHRSHLD